MRLHYHFDVPEEKQVRVVVDTDAKDVYKRQKLLSNFLGSLQKIGKRFFHFLDTGREMIFDGPSEMSWGLTGKGGVLEKQENITASQARTHVL